MQKIKLVNIRRVLGAVITSLVLVGPTTVGAQQYSSGSTGELGALNPVANIAIPLPPDGVLNYTTVNIPKDIVVTFVKNSDNTPVYILAQGDVTITGTVRVTGQHAGEALAGVGYYGVGKFGSPAGPGGWDGGGYGSGSWTSEPGSGPLGGGAGGGGGGPLATNYWYVGSGGSGGGGSASYIKAGGGGGGAITIACSGTLSINGVIEARGGDSAGGNGSGGGGGGMIRLVATTVGGTGSLQTHGGGGGAGNGMIRVEAYSFFGTLIANSYPSAFVTPPRAALPFVQGVRPTISVVAVNGIPPVGTLGGYFPPNSTIPANQAVEVALVAFNIPPGTVIKVQVNYFGAPKGLIVESTPLLGSFQFSQASALVNIPLDAVIGSLEPWIESIPVQTLP